MSGVMSSIFFFILALGVLVTVHEFGHFWVARKLGVKVLRFSVGFGKPIFSWKRKNDQTEYVIAAIPLGGYVKMLDETEGHVDEHERDQAFNRKPLASRFAIVFAGPAFNFLLAILAYWLVFVIGVSGMKPVVGDVRADSIAANGGFQYGDVIVSIDEKSTSTWKAVLLSLLDKSLDKETITVVVNDAENIPQDRTLNLTDPQAVLGTDNLLEHLGFQPYRPPVPPLIDQVTVGGRAAAAGIQQGDLVISADGQNIHDWEQWVNYVKARPEQNILVGLDRQGEILMLELRPALIQTEEGDIGRIGASVRYPAELLKELEATVQYSPVDAIPASFEKTWEMTVLTLRMLVNMFTGNVSVKNISGPVSIAQYAGYTAAVGVATYIAFIALISISLGVLNLLPIPLLDGGHLMYYTIEFIKGSPVSENTQLIGQRFGILVLAGLMSLAFYNDFVRLFG